MPNSTVDLPLGPDSGPDTAAGTAAGSAAGPGAETELEPLVAGVEARLLALEGAQRERDIPAIEQQSHELHRALARAVDRFVFVARHGGVPEALRQRLSRASAHLARQREALSRATAALDRAIDVLMPDAAPAGKVYLANGLTEPLRRPGSLNA